MSTCPSSERSQRFHDLMDNAMTVSFHKYGPVADAYPHKVNAIQSLKKRLRLFEQTGNGDYLVDIANFAMIEFMHPGHEDYKFEPTDGGEGRYWQSGGSASEKRNDGARA